MMGAPQKSAFQFTNPLLVEMIFSVNEEYQPPEEGTQDIPVEINVSKPDLEACGDSAAVVFLRIKIGDEENPELPYFLSATMKANFRWEPALPPELVKTLLSQNAPSLLLGYLRPHIAQITGASPVGAYHLPFMSFVPQDERPPEPET